jgi:DNA-binding CsgD family transcriptional regulator
MSRDQETADQPPSRVLFLVPADGTFELETQHLQDRFGLTPMQGRVVGLTAQGLTNKEIASRLSISSATVHTHLAAAFQKTGIPTRAGLVALAFGARFGIDFSL